MSSETTTSYETTPVFIVSTGRSGSQMMARALAIHPAVCALHEPAPQLNTLALLKWSGTRDSSFVRYQLEKRRAKLISQIKHNRLRYIESSHYLSHLIPELDELFGAKFIHIHRDGRYFIESGLKRGWYQGKDSTLRAVLGKRFRRWLRHRYLAEIGSTWDDHKLTPPSHCRNAFEKTAWLWAELNRVILRNLERIPNQRKLSVRLEQFGNSTMSGILEFMGLEHTRGMLDEMLEIARTRPNRSEVPADTGGLNWTESQHARFTEIAGDIMSELGYSIQQEPRMK